MRQNLGDELKRNSKTDTTNFNSPINLRPSNINPSQNSYKNLR